MEIVLSTRNVSKAEQIKAVLNGPGIKILTLSEAGIEGEAVEDGQTLEENATKKAAFAHTSGHWSMADDTGLFIDALDGRPGIHAARWAGDGLTTEEIMNYTLDKLQGVPDHLRTATFKTVAVLISPTGERYVFEGEVKGILLAAPRTACQPNMPYSALFAPIGHAKTWSEMTVDEENAVSHRGQAFRKLRNFLRDHQKMLL